jgi:hypothetical protein
MVDKNLVLNIWATLQDTVIKYIVVHKADHRLAYCSWGGVYFDVILKSKILNFELGDIKLISIDSLKIFILASNNKGSVICVAPLESMVIFIACELNLLIQVSHSSAWNSC